MPTPASKEEAVMTPDSRSKRGRKTKQLVTYEEMERRIRPSSDDTHEIVFFKRHKDDDPTCLTPARDFMNNDCPPAVRSKLQNILVAVAKAPPKKFVGGGAWEAMSGEMSGWFEARADGPGRSHYRLFCRIDLEAIGEARPLLVLVTGLKKRFMTTFSSSDYAKIKALGIEYFSRNPRSTE